MASTMSYSTPKSNYSSLKYRGRGARQTRSYENTPIHQENAAGHQDTSLLPPKFRGSSLRLPHAISHNLISLVCKFEALDALNIPFKHSSPRIASSIGSQNSSARRVGAGCTKLFTTFTPSMNRRPLGYPHIFSKDNLPSGRDDIFISSNSPLRFSPTKLNSRYVGKAQSSPKPTSTRLRGGDRDACQTTASNISGTDKVPNEGLNNKDVRRSIRDKIRLYDGSESNPLPLGFNYQRIT
jgi:hypothetical protein